ncbi:MBL fold metallo-hydrolase [Algihabitans albus]|uniref:MBL fold metallo-hydrolase n=1 Tax=Algihabitans albus TaxID=2164067 RepID=UPI000E5C67AE|nr:MBL fold metallo-hydrolase [Algihabitans albus]
MKITVLGSGGSNGVPLAGGRPGGTFGEGVDPEEPKNWRRRVSALVETRDKTILIDCSPDLRLQLLDNRITRVDAVLFTHAHADHCHGLDELRTLSYTQKGPIAAYMSPQTRSDLIGKFDYVFTSSHPQAKLYPAIMADHAVEGAFEAAGVPAVIFDQDHGNVVSSGFRIGPFAYSTDCVTLDEAAFAALEGIEVWIVDCLRFEPHPTHTHFDRTLEWIARVKPKRAVLTHLNHTMDYATVAARCPEGVEPGYDGLVIELAGTP